MLRIASCQLLLWRDLGKCIFPSSSVQNLPAMQKTWVQSLSWEDPLQEDMATHSSALAWRIPGTEEPGGLQFMGSQRVGDDCAANFHFHRHHKST